MNKRITLWSLLFITMSCNLAASQEATRTLPAQIFNTTRLDFADGFGANLVSHIVRPGFWRNSTRVLFAGWKPYSTFTGAPKSTNFINKCALSSASITATIIGMVCSERMLSQKPTSKTHKPEPTNENLRKEENISKKNEEGSFVEAITTVLVFVFVGLYTMKR